MPPARNHDGVALGGKTYHVKMATRYPDAGRIDLSISPAHDFKVVVRYPDRAEASVQGRAGGRARVSGGGAKGWRRQQAYNSKLCGSPGRLAPPGGLALAATV